MNRIAVLGDPISHSLSPDIHLAFAKHHAIPLQYDRIQTSKEHLSKTLQKLQSRGYLGVNLTAPLKEAAFVLCHTRTPSAATSGSVNTIRFSEEGVLGHSTDGEGWWQDFSTRFATSDLEGKTVAFLGAGGAVRAILPVVLHHQAKRVWVYARRIEAIQSLKNSFGDLLEAAPSNETPDLLIQAASGFDFNLSSTLDWKQTLCYDLGYAGLRPFEAWCQQQKVGTYVNGLGMLVEQAALAFEFWFGICPSS